MVIVTPFVNKLMGKGTYWPMEDNETEMNYYEYVCKKKSKKNKPNKQKYYVVEKLIEGRNLKYSRSSLILVEESYNNCNGRNEPALILFYNKKWNTYVEIGGKIEKLGDELDNILIETARRELMEETLNSIGINVNMLRKSTYIDFNDEKTALYSRTFTVGIKQNQFDEKVYYRNKDIILKNNISSVWKETTEVTRFYISDILDCISKMKYNYSEYENVVCKNATGAPCNIYYRTIGMLDQLIKDEVLFEVLDHPKNMISYDFNSCKFTEKFLIGTKTLEIMP